MIEGILTAKDGKRYRVYRSSDIRVPHDDFEYIVEMNDHNRLRSYIVWEKIPEKENA